MQCWQTMALRQRVCCGFSKTLSRRYSTRISTCNSTRKRLLRATAVEAVGFHCKKVERVSCCMLAPMLLSGRLNSHYSIVSHSQKAQQRTAHTLSSMATALRHMQTQLASSSRASSRPSSLPYRISGRRPRLAPQRVASIERTAQTAFQRPQTGVDPLTAGWSTEEWYPGQVRARAFWWSGPDSQQSEQTRLDAYVFCCCVQHAYVVLLTACIHAKLGHRHCSTTAAALHAQPLVADAPSAPGMLASSMQAQTHLPNATGFTLLYCDAPHRFGPCTLLSSWTQQSRHTRTSCVCSCASPRPAARARVSSQAAGGHLSLEDFSYEIACSWADTIHSKHAAGSRVLSAQQCRANATCAIMADPAHALS